MLTIEEKGIRYEELICRIEGVHSAKLRFDEHSGQVAECHVLADKTRNVKQLVRDIQSAMAASFGENIDYRLISIARVDNALDLLPMPEYEPAQAAEPASRRPKLLALNIGYEQGMFRANITMEFCGQNIVGEATGIGGMASPRQQVLAQAVASAMQKCLPDSCSIRIMDVARFTVAGQSAISVAVHMLAPAGVELLLGSAFIYDDENLCIVKATLDALNRKIATTAPGS